MEGFTRGFDGDDDDDVDDDDDDEKIEQLETGGMRLLIM